MEQLISAIQDWPVLVQGAIGSAVFWLVLTLGQQITGFFSTVAREHSKEKQTAYLRNEIFRHRALKDGNSVEGGAFYAAVLWYRASRNVISGLIWLCFGLIFSSIIGVFGLVGFIGCLYYLFAALDIVKPVRFEGDIENKVKELQTKLKDHEKT